MKMFLKLLLVGIGSFACVTNLAVAEVAKAVEKVKGPVGLQLYSLRDQFAKDVPGTLDKVRDYGLKYVELAGTYGMSPEKFKSELDARGLEAASGHFPFERFRDQPEAIAVEAKALGLKYVGCAWIPHDGPFSEKTCRDAAATFNKAGEILAKQGLKLFYHTHGYEFQPHSDGTLFDLLVKETNPKFVTFEMDVFWVVHGGQNPVELLGKYGNRWGLMHLKGMKESTKTGLLTGGSEVTNDVAVGKGKIDYAPVLRAAKKAKVKWYFIEDESPSSEQQIAESLRYLGETKW
ncbi:MAG: sugar phosphate isomerase/epimerase [Verrucomicrobiota bacterium]